MEEKCPGELKRWSRSPFDSESVWAAQLGMDCWVKEHLGLTRRGSRSWVEDWLGSSCPGLPRKPLWGQGRPQVSGIYVGWGRPGFLRDVTCQIAQGCPPFPHSNSPDLHPWLHRTDPHLRGFQCEEKIP